MNLWFRLTRMLLRRPWRDAMHATDTVVTPMRVWPLDLDINRHVTNGRYFSMADIARMDFLFRSGAYRVAWQKKALPIVGDNWGKFRKELKLFQKFEIHTKMLGWDHKWIFMQHEFVRHGRVSGAVIMRGVFRSGGKIIDPQAFIQGLELETQSPTLPDWLSQWSACCDNLSEQIRQNEQSAAKSG